MRTLKAKLKLIWVILTSKTAHVLYQKQPGTQPYSGGFGQGDLRDLILFAKEIKQMHDGFMGMINEVAAEAGELHALQALKDATDVIIGDTPDVGN
jgi:hypothetical protein